MTLKGHNALWNSVVRCLKLVVLQVSHAGDEFLGRVFAIAFTESSHSAIDVLSFARDFFAKVISTSCLVIGK